MSYVIVSGNQQDVSVKVNSLLSVGFELHGSISVVMNQTNRLQYTQPMVHKNPDLSVKNMNVTFMSNGQDRNIDVLVVQDSEQLNDLLNRSLHNKQDKSRWVHCRSLNNLSEDLFVKDGKYAFTDLNIEQGFYIDEEDNSNNGGARRNRTSRRRL